MSCSVLLPAAKLPDFLETCEVLIFLGEYHRARTFLKRLPQMDPSCPRIRTAQLRTAAGLQQWETGLDMARRVRPTDFLLLRQAAAQFLYAHAEMMLQSGHIRRAIEILRPLPQLWPEGTTIPAVAA